MNAAAPIALPCEHDIIEQFRAAMAEKAIVTSDSIEADGKIHRFHVEGDRKGSKNGWLILHIDERPAGAFGCNKRHGVGTKFSWSAKCQARPLTREERREYAEKMARQKAEKAAAEAARHAAAAERAKAIWEAAKPADDSHPYLKAKGVKAHGLRVGKWEVINPETGEIRVLTDKALLVPFCDRTRALHSLQAILPKKMLGGGTRDKDFLKDGAKLGFFHAIGKPQELDGRRVFVICEGYATGASIHEATGHCVLVTFDTSNLAPVASSIRERQAEAIILIAADNDRWVTEPIDNPGVRYATRAALAVNGLVAIPQFADLEGKPTDFNDLHARQGLAVVAAQIEAALSLGYATTAAPAAEPDMPWEEVPVEAYAEVPAAAAGNVAVCRSNSTDEEDRPPQQHREPPVTINGMQLMQPTDFPDLSAKLRPLNTITNLAALLDWFGISARYNMVKKETELVIPGLWGTSDNAANVRLAHLNSLAAHCSLPRDNLAEYVKAIADMNAYNPVLDWIDSKPWDGVSRIGELAQTLTCADGAQCERLLRRWLISCAAALVHKNFWCKGVLTLQGAQDLGKTSWFRRLVPAELGAFREGVSLDPNNKDSVTTAVSHWIVELGELESTLRREIESLKAFITQPIDRLRRPYDRLDSEYPRRTVFCASVNSDRFLKDETGNDRFWVIQVTKVDHQHEIDIQQVWAEAMSLYRSGEQWHLSADEKARLTSTNEQFRQVSPFEELLLAKFALRGGDGKHMSASQILLELGYDRPTRAQATEAGQVLNRLGATSKRVGGTKQYYLSPLSRSAR